MSWESLNDWQLALPLRELRELLLGHSSLVAACLVAAILALQAIAIVRAHRRTRVLGAELARVRLQLLGVERLQYEADEKAQRDSVRITQLERTHQRATAAFGKPDAQLALAMIRAGADARALVDCGLSHGESHLMRAIHPSLYEKHRGTESCVISSDHDH